MSTNNTNRIASTLRDLLWAAKYAQIHAWSVLYEVRDDDGRVAERRIAERALRGAAWMEKYAVNSVRALRIQSLDVDEPPPPIMITQPKGEDA